MDATVRSILIVDDEPQVAEMLYRMLKRRYAVLVETDARRALALIESGVAFDLVLSDLTMAPMSGMQLFERVRRAVPAQAERFLLMTGGACTHLEVEGFLGCWPHEILRKPFALPELERQIEGTLARLAALEPAGAARASSGG
jgi:DNA-binding NtrC family response regulator